jgi:penicillin V acylase-like amidase (Ntn superfamily)
VVDSTLWTSASDLRNHRSYFQTYANRRIRMIDLKSLDFDAGAISSIPMAGDEVVEDMSVRAPSAR